ncbi:MAG TPA: undecaprenyl-diphosphate phosphatase [Patescibacteria group bacterium]|nr:undecaprenyl-diphosphate phosphatase [Patescibacteria group bacterium]
MTIIQSIVLGAVEGITEFLPISSTAHLILTANFLFLPSSEFVKFFEVFIQAGAIAAVVVLYISYISSRYRLIKNLFFSFIPTAIVGFLLYKTIKNVFFDSFSLIAVSIGVVGVVFLLVELSIKKRVLSLTRSLHTLSYPEAIVIGLAQAITVVPGVSRAGMVIIAMIFMRFKRSEAAIYSFLLAVPTIFAASLFDLIKTDKTVIFDTRNMLLTAIGFVTSFITALLVIRWFVRFLQNRSLVVFGLYRLILSVLLFIGL